MKAVLLLRKRLVVSTTAFIEIVVWKVPERVRGSRHDFKYSLSFVSAGICRLRYDNEAGKGDHKHVDGVEIPYSFTDLETLQADFWSDVESWRTRS